MLSASRNIQVFGGRSSCTSVVTYLDVTKKLVMERWMNLCMLLY